MESGMETAQLTWLCRETLRSRFPYFRGQDVRAEFFPYVGLTHTIRKKGAVWVLRVSDHCRRAPRAVLEAIAVILGCKILRRRPPEAALEAYDWFRRHEAVEQALHTRRRARGRKRIDESEGRHHSLRRILDGLNERFFNGQVEVEKLGWGLRRSWSRLGHYDFVHNTITVSPVLDCPQVPERVAAYIVYHEMLHYLLDLKKPGRRKRHHTAEFRRAERAYPYHKECELFLRDFCRAKGRRRNR